MFQRFDVVFYSPWIGPLLQPGSEPPTGGAESQVYLLSRALARRGLRVGLITYAPAEGLPEEIDGVRIIVQRRPSETRPALRTLAYAASFVRALGAARSRVVVQRAAGTTTGLVGVLARLLGSRFVYSSANVIDFEYGRLEPKRRNVRLFELGVRLANRIVVQTDEQVEMCRSTFGRDSVMIKSIAEPAPRRTAAPEALLWVGRLAPYKRPERFLELARAVPEARFWMIAVASGGIGEDLGRELHRQAADLPNLEMLEPRPRTELMGLVERAVAMVNTADFEGMPNVFLEGWTRGVPALTFAHDPDGVIERHGIGGTAHGSAERFAVEARRLWEARDDQDEIAERCLAYIEREHALDAVVERWIDALGVRERATVPSSSERAPVAVASGE